jgi:hypothetical protein
VPPVFSLLTFRRIEMIEPSIKRKPLLTPVANLPDCYHKIDVYIVLCMF